MKTRTIILGSLLCLGTLKAVADDSEFRFRPGEWDVSPYATYVDKTGGKWGLGAAVTYFVTEQIGVGANSYWTDFGGTLIDNAAGEAYFRIPLMDLVSPYAVGSIGYQFDSHEWFESLGLGVDFRPFEKIFMFSDIQYRFANQTMDGVFLRLGVRFSF
jgi:hypothetical protein